MLKICLIKMTMGKLLPLFLFTVLRIFLQIKKACTLNFEAEIRILHKTSLQSFRSSHPEVFLGKGVLKICSKFTGEHPCRSVISIKLQSKATAKQSNFIEITLWHRCSPVNLLHIFRTPITKNTSESLLLEL